MRHVRLNLVVGLAALSACMPRDRVNASCEWVEPDSTLPVDAKARRAHLALDIRIAKDLGIRHGDSVAGRIWNDANRTARERCTQASTQRIRTLHSLASGDFEHAEGARNVLIDALLVMLPSVLLFAAASRFVVRRAVAGYDAEDRWIRTAVLAVLTPIIAAAGLVGAQVWSVVLESVLLGNEHISYRAGDLPLYRYRFPAYGMALLIFSVAAIRVVRPATGRGARAPTARARR